MPRIPGYEKTVYILGAGFSAPAGGPSQEVVLEKVVDFPVVAGDPIESRKKRLINFLTVTLGIPLADIKHMSLEDIYTPIDRCLADRVSLRDCSQANLENIRSDLDYLIAKVIKEEFANSTKDKQYVDKFATYLVKKAAHRATLAVGARNADEVKKYDPFSVISLNWDILLDNHLDAALQRQDATVDDNDYAPFGVVDYCCYVSSFEGGDRRIRSGLWSLGARGYNIKLLKIHGSLNWLQCTNCQRLFTSFNEKLVVSEKIGEPCRHCNIHDIPAGLRGTLVMPTFLKDFSNFQLKLVWQNAGVELMEATRLVFIGYSLPHADFEFRQLLTRMLHPAATVHAVLWRATNPDQYDEEEKRYRQFFAGHTVTCEPLGVKKFVDDLVA
jgi:hypothetical protein